MLSAAGVSGADIVPEAGRHHLQSPDDWWAIAMGSGYRGTLAQLDFETFSRVRETNLSLLRASGATSIETNVLYAVAAKRSVRLRRSFQLPTSS
ncbi:hypothetical protein [Methylosinus sp. PW1]|uniref:hypothetical protein n=1 Tax=Methylosinus sp. PW1 TaxID=107636 RepID=UPI001AEC52F0|nr:hypothetical protein [Methylosinus sp. PW1]